MPKKKQFNFARALIALGIISAFSLGIGIGAFVGFSAESVVRCQFVLPDSFVIPTYQ